MDTAISDSEIVSLIFPSLELVSIRGTHVTVSLPRAMPTPERGTLMLEAEKMLRQQVDPRIEVFLEPKGDMNKLRLKLRGVKV